MNKTELIAAVAEKTGLTKKDAERVVSATFETVTETIKKGEKVMWFCRNCGHVEVAESAPAVCPVCAHPQAFFEVRKENY